MRAIKFGLLGLVALLMLVTVAMLLLINTERGSRFLIASALPESVTIGSVEGPLAGPLLLQRLQVTTPGALVAIDRVELEWQPRRLLARDLLVDHLRANGVTVTAVPPEAEEPEEPAEPFTLPDRVELPVSIALEEFNVTDVEVRTADAEEPFVIDEIDLSAGFDDATLSLHRLVVRSAMLDAGIEGALEADGDYPVNISADLILRHADVPELRSSTLIDGDLQSLRIRESIAAPYNVLVDARVATPLEDLRFDVEANVEELVLNALRPDLPAVTLRLTASADGRPTDLDFATNVEALHEDVRLVALLEGQLEGELLTIDALELAQPAGDASVAGRGTVMLNDRLDAEATLSWRGLEWPLAAAEPDLRSSEGNITFKGSMDGYELSSSASVSLPGDVPMQVALNGTGDGNHVNTILGIDVLDGRIDGSAAVAWQPSLEADLELNGTDVDPGAFHPDWPGRLRFALEAAAEVVGDETSAEIETLTVDGELRDRPVSVEANAAYASGELSVERLIASFASARLDLNGRYADTVDLNWTLDAEDLGEVLPEAGGRISAAGSLSGTRTRPGIDAEIRASGVEFEEYAVDSVSLVADLDLADDAESSLVLNVNELKSAAIDADRIEFDLGGTQGEHRLRLTASTSQGSAEIAVDGELRNLWSEAASPAWAFNITEATLEYPDLAPWTLDSEADGLLSAEETVIEHHCWRSGSAGLCLAGGRSPQQLSAEFELSDFDFAYLEPFMPPHWIIESAVSGEGTVEQRGDEALRANVHMTIGEGRVATTVDNVDAEEARALAETVLELEPSDVLLRLDESGSNADVALNFKQGGVMLNATLAASTDPIAERELEGALSIDVPDIGFLLPFVPDIEALDGKLDGQLEFAGTAGAPLVTGEMGLDGGRLASGAAGIEVTEIALNVVGRGADGIGIEGSARSGGGHLRLDGDLNVNSQPPTAALTVSGENFQVADTREARVFVSPDVRIVAGADDIRVSGAVHVPRADITPQTVPESAVTASSDVVELEPASGEDGTDEDAAGRELFAELDLSLGDDVRFEGFGLKARFSGDLTIFEEPGQPTTASGEISIADGEYRAYGQGLVIESGRIIFAGGPATEPALDVRAVRRPQENILVGADVRGAIAEPDFTLFSEPPMTQQEQLSYLVLGRSLADAPAGESSALQQASLALGVKGGNFLAENIGENIGVDEFTIRSGSGEAGAGSDPADAALVIGKYLSPKLYLSYGVGLFNPISVLQMRYEFTRNLKFTTESSSESTGADLEYTFELGGRDENDDAATDGPD